MKNLAAPGIVLGYIALVAIGTPIFGPAFGPIFVPCFLATLSASLVWLYVGVIGGRLVVPLATVVFVTFVFPLVTLLAVGWPAYQSWPAVVGAFAFAFQAASPLWGLEVLFPLAAALITAALIHRWRSNKALNPDARQQPRAG